MKMRIAAVVLCKISC